MTTIFINMHIDMHQDILEKINMNAFKYHVYIFF